MESWIGRLANGAGFLPLPLREIAAIQKNLFLRIWVVKALSRKTEAARDVELESLGDL